MKYQHKENGKVITIQDFNEKTKVYLIRFDESGKETNIVSSTLKRWYIPFEEEAEVAPLIDLDNPISEEEAEANGMITGDQALEQAETLGLIEEEEVVIEEPERLRELREERNQAENELLKATSEVVTDIEKELTDEQYAEIGKEIAEQAKQKAKKARDKKKVKKEKADINQAVDSIIKAIENCGMQYKHYESRTITVKNAAGNILGEIHVGDKKFVMAMRGKFVPEGFQADRIRNCSNSHAFDIPYAEMDKFANLMNAIKEVK